MQRVFAAIGLAAALATPRPALAKPACAPGAVLDGEPALVADLASALAALAITSPASDCPAIHATVARADTGLTVTVRDPAGRYSQRRVTDTRVAATFIESWVRADIEAPLLAPRRPTWRPPSASVAATRPSEPTVKQPILLSLAVAAATSDGDDNSSWTTVTVGVCAKLGPLCLGALGRFADNRDFTTEGALTPARRHTSDLMVEARWPLPLGQAVLAPRVAAGIGWLRSSNTPPPLPPECEPAAPDCAPEPVADPFTVTTPGLRLDLGVSLVIPITRGVAVDLGAGYQFAPTARRDRVLPDGTDPTLPDDDPLYDELALPGEPQRWLSFGIGLRLGAP